MSHPAQAPSSVVLLIALVSATVVSGCTPAQRTIPFAPPNARALAPADNPAVSYGGDGCPMRRPQHVLALSGGGAYGAYTAGYLAGWTRSGTRPEFDVVTGISTGSLIAPLAFLGPEYDGRLRNLYTRVQASDVFRIRAWVTIPFKDAAATSYPLKHLIEAEITQEMMDRVAAEHRKGRRLYVGTTNLDTRRMVVWDMGAIACRPCPEGCALFRDVLLASCSVPGVFPPVQFNVEVDGQPATELHVDGGVTAQLFVPSQVFAAAAQGAIEDTARTGAAPGPDPMPPAGHLYVLVAGKLYPDAAPVRPLVLPVLGASANSVIYAHCRAELANLYGLSRAAGLQYHLTALRQEFPALDTSVSFDPEHLNKLYAEGAQQGECGTAWMPGPPTLCPGDGDYIRTGVKLRTPPGEPVVPIQVGN